MEQPSPTTNSCQAQLEALREEYEAFAYIVSHDLKAPVRAVNNLADWIEEDLEGKFTQDTEAHFKMLRKRLSRLDQMIQALLEFSRATRLNLQTGTVNIEQCIKDAVTRLAANRPFKLEFYGSCPSLETLNAKLTGILDELLKNAIVFNDKTEIALKITLQDLEDEIQVTVTDNGPGIPESSLGKIFDMFYTVQSKDSLETTGAGLAIVKKILNLVQGKINAANTPEGGMAFSFTWPKKLPENLAAESKTSS